MSVPAGDPASPATPRADDGVQSRRGALYGAAAYGLWGVLPLYLAAVRPASPFEILAHRMLWSLLVCLLLLAVLRRLGRLIAVLRRPRAVAVLALAGLLVSTNWIVYTVAVLSGRTNEAALGYFLNPLVTIALGVVLLRERLRRLQWVAVGIGAVAAVYLTVTGGSVPWVPLVLAFSFALYGLVKKRVGSSVGALESFTVETLMLAPVAATVLVVIGVGGGQTFTTEGPLHVVLMGALGIVTAVPLLLFAAAARRVPLTTIGLLQFLTPVLQLLCGVLFLGEVVPSTRWVGFGIVWVALLVMSIDLVRSGRRRRRLRPNPQVATAPVGG